MSGRKMRAYGGEPASRSKEEALTGYMPGGFYEMKRTERERVRRQPKKRARREGQRECEDTDE